jgi:hypothetical protein
VEVIAAITIYGTFVCFLLFPLLGCPPMLHKTAIALLFAELVALGLYSYGSDAVATLGRTAASIDVPLLALGLLVLAIMRGVLRWRRQRVRS